MLSDEDYQEAVRRYKNMTVKGHERQRYHALIVVHQGYSYREVGRILLGDEETIRRWVDQYHERRLLGAQQNPAWGGEHGQRELGPEQVESLQRLLREEAMAGTRVGGGGAKQAGGQTRKETFGGTDRKRGRCKVS